MATGSAPTLAGAVMGIQQALIRNRALPLTASASPPDAFGTEIATGFQPPPSVLVTSEFVTASTNGGSPPVAFNGWTRISGSTAVVANNGAATGTAFSATLALGASETAVFRATFTDAAAQQAFVDVPVTLTYVDLQ